MPHHEPPHGNEHNDKVSVKVLLDLLTLWENHMKTIDQQLGDLTTAVTSGLADLTTAVKGLSPASPEDLKPVTDAIATLQGSVTSMAGNVTLIGNKLGSDTFVPSTPAQPPA